MWLYAHLYIGHNYHPKTGKQDTRSPVHALGFERHIVQCAWDDSWIFNESKIIFVPEDDRMSQKKCVMVIQF